MNKELILANTTSKLRNVNYVNNLMVLTELSKNTMAFALGAIKGMAGGRRMINNSTQGFPGRISPINFIVSGFCHQSCRKDYLLSYGPETLIVTCNNCRGRLASEYGFGLEYKWAG